MSYEILKGSAQFLMGISCADQLYGWLQDHQQIKAVAFVGRSNVGKSSIINNIFGKKTARTSKTPGRTREINVFSFKIYNTQDKEDPLASQSFYLFDLPGYGFAQVSAQMSKNWDLLINTFFENIPPSSAIINLQDARHPDQKADKDYYKFVKNFDIKTILVFNKIDKLKTQKQRSQLNKLKPQLFESYKNVDQIYFASALSSKGVDQVTMSVVHHLLES